MSDKNSTVEQKMSELRKAVAWFESEDFSLTQASEKFKQASSLAVAIEHDLKHLENEINILKQSFEEV